MKNFLPVVFISIIVVSIHYCSTDKDELTVKFLEAARQGDLNAIKTHIDKGADINSRDEYGNTALIKASIWGMVDVVKVLIDEGAGVHITNNFGNTALKVAFSRNNSEVIKILKEAETKHNFKNQTD